MADIDGERERERERDRQTDRQTDRQKILIKFRFLIYCVIAMKNSIKWQFAQFT